MKLGMPDQRAAELGIETRRLQRRRLLAKKTCAEAAASTIRLQKRLGLGLFPCT